MRIALLLVLGMWSWSVDCASQTRVPGPAPSILFSAVRRGPTRLTFPEERRDSLPRNIPATYWKEGALIGGGVGLIAGAYLGFGLCHMSEHVNNDCTGSLLLGGVVGAALLALPGALIGGVFPKHGPAT